MPYDPYELANLAQIKAVRLRKQRKRYQQKPKVYKYHMDLNHGSQKQRQGAFAESIARDYLIEQGLKILAQNLMCHIGEIDILAIDSNIIVFIEVRARKNNYYGDAAASINLRKQQKLIRTANYFLPRIYKYTGCKMACRFDVIAIDSEQISWLKHAFSA